MTDYNVSFVPRVRQRMLVLYFLFSFLSLSSFFSFGSLEFSASKRDDWLFPSMMSPSHPSSIIFAVRLTMKPTTIDESLGSHGSSSVFSPRHRKRNDENPPRSTTLSA